MRLIDADALVQALHEAGTVMGKPHFRCRTVYECINKAPKIDAVPVVRCKDCFLYGECQAAKFYGDNGFCSCGERRRDE